MTILAENLKTIRKNLNCTQMALAQVLDIGFRTYVRYEAGERDAPVAILVKLAKLGNISLDRLLTLKITENDLDNPDLDTPPPTAKNLEVIGGSMEEGRLVFKGIKDDFLISTDTNEKSLLNRFRKLDTAAKKQTLQEAEWIINNTSSLRRPTSGKRPSRKTQKMKNAARLKKIAKTVKKITVKG